MAKKHEPPVCPRCGSKGPFDVEIPQWVPFTYDPNAPSGAEWEGDRDYDIRDVANLRYRVTCKVCDPLYERTFEAEPWT